MNIETFEQKQARLNTPVGMVFTHAEWLLIAIACTKVQKSAFIDGFEAQDKCKAIAGQIAAKTGKLSK